MGVRMEQHLDGIDQERRDTVLKLVRGAAFAVPLVASFALNGPVSVASAVCNLTSPSTVCS